MLAGDIDIDGERAAAPSFVVIEPGAEISVRSDFGATLLAWAEGATAWSDGTPRPELYGF